MDLAGRIFKSSFLKSIATVTGGQLAAASVPFLAAPVLGRLYSPEDYGPLGSIMSFVAVLGSVATWQYAQAIVIVKRESECRVIVQLCLAVAVITALLSIPFAMWLAYSSHSVSSGWFLLLPLSVLAAGISACISSLANRWQLYHRSALIQWIPVLLSVIVSVVLGTRGFHAQGLLWSYLFSQVLALGFGFWVIAPRYVNPLRRWSWIRIKFIAHRHSRFPIYTMPTGFISSATLNAPVFALTSLHSPTGVGLFNRANQLLGMPLGLIGGAVAQVFQRRAAQDVHTSGHCHPLFKKTLLMLLSVGFLPTLFLTIAAPSLFGWFLGPKWIEAGHVARWLAPMLLFRVVSSPLSTVFYVMNAQRLDFLLSLLGCAGTWVAVILASNIFSVTTAVIAAYAIGYSLTYCSFLIFSWRLSKGRLTGNQRNTIQAAS